MRADLSATGRANETSIENQSLKASFSIEPARGDAATLAGNSQLKVSRNYSAGSRARR